MADPNEEIANALVGDYFSDLPIPGTTGPQYQPTFWEKARNIPSMMNRDLENAAMDIASALMAPGNALRGEYDQVGIMGDGSVTMADPRMYDAAAELSGLINFGTMPIPRPRGSLGMGGRVDEYGMSHRPNTRQEGMTLDNPLYAWGEDIYSPQAVQYYGTLDKVADRESLRAIAAARSNPAALVTIYRAVPKNVDAGINPGDWVTTSRKYAQDHGEGWLGGDYRIVEQQVPAGQLATSGDSIHEWGWWPDDARPRNLPFSDSLSLPAAPSVEQLQSLARIEKVPLAQARATNSLQWDRFNAGDHPPPMAEGFTDRPIAVRKENGEYLIYDGHHRTALAASDGMDAVDMYVIDAKDYAPMEAGRKPQASKADISDEDLLRMLGL